MALDKKRLELDMKGLPSSSSKKEAANNFAKVFADYYEEAEVLGIKPSFTKSVLEGLFFKSMLSDQFLETLGDSLQNFLLTFGWYSKTNVASPGTTKAIGTSLNITMKSYILKHSKQNDIDKLKELSEIVDAWSKTAMVTLTNTSSGTTLEAKVT